MEFVGLGLMVLGEFIDLGLIVPFKYTLGIDRNWGYIGIMAKKWKQLFRA